MASGSISDDIRKSVRNGLSLECDAKLLEYMEIISNKLINRAKITSNNIDALSSELQRTSICLDNVTNRLSSLSHTKFVENRVYEDDETIANIKEVPVEIKTKEYNPIKTLNTVIRNNMKMLDNCYEKVSVELDDSDEEDEQIKSIVYRPKSKYETRPIPHLIGSKEWKEKWHIGIYDSDESFSDNENEEFSEGSDSLSFPSNGPTISESGSSVWSINRNSNFNNIPNKRNNYTSSDEEISTTSKTSSNERIVKNIPPVHEQRYYVHQPKGKGLFDDSSESENENRNAKKNKNLNNNIPEPLPRKHQQLLIGSNKISNIFNDEPPEIDAAVVQQKNKKNPSKLFFESDEEEFNNQNEHIKQNSAQISIPQSDNIRKKTVNLFDDDDFNSIMKGLDKKTDENLIKVAGRKINLFDDQNEEENKIKDKIPEFVEKESKLFDNKSVDEINGNIIHSTHKDIVESLPSNSKGIENNLRTSLFEDEDDLFSETIKPIKKILEKPSISKTKIANLFDDTPPDDEFDNLFKTSGKSVKQTSNSEITDLPPNNIPPISKKNIFNEDREDKDENIFENQTENLKNTPSKNEESSKDLDQNNIKKTFNNEEISKNFVSTKKNIFNDDADDKSESIFENNIDTIENTNKSESTEQPIKYESLYINKKPVSNNVFDDVLEDDDDFFKSLVTQNNNKISKQTTKIIEEEKEILDNKAENKTNLFDFPVNDKNNINQLKQLVDQETIKSVINYKLPNIFSDEPPVDNYDNLLRHSGVDEISNEMSNNDVSLENSVQNNNDHKLSSNKVNVDDCEKQGTDDISNTVDATSKINEFSKPNKSTMNSVFIPTIFDETPPDDNDDIFISPTKSNLHETDIFEVSADNFIFNKTQTVPSVTNYDSVVFQDSIPPDDSNEDNTIIFSQNNDEMTKSSFQNIIVDNTFTDIATSSQKTQFKTNLNFDNIPPTDSFNEKNINENVNNKDLDLIEEKSLSVSDLVKKASTISKHSDTDTLSSKQIISPKKLSTNLNINVSALMPGAKRPTISSVNRDESDGSIVTKIETSNFGEESKTNLIEKNIGKEQSHYVKQVAEEQLEQNILISLNKNRPKILQKRRPSTKQGRLENYRKTIENNEFEKNVEEIDIKNKKIDMGETRTIKKIEHEVIKKKSLQKSDTLSSVDIKDGDCLLTKSSDNQGFSKNTDNKLQPQMENIAPHKNKESLDQSNIQLKEKDQSDVQSEKIYIAFADNNNDDDDDWLFNATSKSNTTEQHFLSNNKKVPLNIKEKELPNNVDDLDNTTQPGLRHSLKNPIKEDVSVPNNNSLLTNEAELFSTDRINDDWLFKATSKSSSIEKKSNFSTVTKPQTENVRDPLTFDADDLFSRNSAKIITKNEVLQKNATEKTNKPTEKLPSIENEQQIFKKIKIYKKKPITEKSISVVEETVKKSIKPIEKIKSKSTGLFDSDDDEDDLFGSSNNKKKISIKKNTPAIESNKKIFNVPKKNNLFDDIDDDDDDLFGTKITKAQSAVTKKMIEKPKTNQSQGESTVYNPLADLLNEQ